MNEKVIHFISERLGKDPDRREVEQSDWGYTEWEWSIDGHSFLAQSWRNSSLTIELRIRSEKDIKLKGWVPGDEITPAISQWIDNFKVLMEYVR